MLMMITNFFIDPFLEFAFMQRALLGSFLLVLSACPFGVFLILRRMSLAGDAIAHAILPGTAFGFLLYGLDIIPMALGGLCAGMIVALGSGLVSRYSEQKEDASMASFYLISLALGVLVISLHGSSLDLMHVLFGSILALDKEGLLFITLTACLSFLFLFIFWRALIAECMDTLFLRSVSKIGAIVHLLFLAFAVLNLVSGFQAMGSLLSTGLMIIPGAASRFWVNNVFSMCFLSVFFGFLSCFSGLLLSWHASFASGPSIILSAGMLYFLSLLLAPKGVVRPYIARMRHRIA